MITTDARMTGSTKGKGARTSAAPKPTAIMATKADGTSHKARPPKSADQRPTATMARMWSMPKSGCKRRAAKEDRDGRRLVQHSRPATQWLSPVF
jgi:hypothetical protein